MYTYIVYGLQQKELGSTIICNVGFDVSIFSRFFILASLTLTTVLSSSLCDLIWLGLILFLYILLCRLCISCLNLATKGKSDDTT